MLTALEIAGLSVVVNAKVADILVSSPNGVSAREVAGRVQLPEEKLTRIMRTLSVRHIFLEGMIFTLLPSTHSRVFSQSKNTLFFGLGCSSFPRSLL